MAKGYATRRYQLTINNPQEHGYDHNVIKAALEKGAKLLYWCMADEVGQEETYHIHLFLVYENPVMFTTLKNKFPTAHIEVPQWGKNSENYTRKTNTQSGTIPYRKELQIPCGSIWKLRDVSGTVSRAAISPVPDLKESKAATYQ